MDIKEVIELVTVEAALRDHGTSLRPIYNEVLFRLGQISDELIPLQKKRAEDQAKAKLEAAAKIAQAKAEEARRVRQAEVAANQPQARVPTSVEKAAREEALNSQASAAVAVPHADNPHVETATSLRRP